MKKLVFLLLAMPLVVIAQQEKFALKGKIGHLNAPATIYLRYSNNGNNVFDSAMLVDGSFKFKGEIDASVKASLTVNHTGKGRVSDGLSIFLVKGTIKVKSVDSVKNAVVRGGKLNHDLRSYNLALKPVTDKSRNLNAEYNALTPEQKKDKMVMDQISKKSEAISEERRQMEKKFISKNPGTIVSLDALNSYGGYAPDYAEVEPIFETLSANVRNSKAGIDYAVKLEKIKLTSVGAFAPDFTQNDPNGTPVTLSSFRGKYVLIDFWASWCGPCRAENPNVVKAYQAYKNKNFTILGVSLDQTNAHDKWVKAITDDHLEWNHVSDLNYWKNAVAVEYGINAIPQNFLVAPDGKIVAKNVRGEELQKTLENVIDNGGKKSL